TQEFYVNDHGVQMDVFGNSISVRYMQLLGHDVEMPEKCYGGLYVKDIAQSIIDADGNKYESLSDEERMAEFREIGYKLMLENQREICSSIGTNFEVWFSERTLYVKDENGKSMVDYALEAMKEKGYIYEDEGAIWFRSTELGDDKNRVLIKANGEMTYFMSDVAYHYNKMSRGFDHLINIWGADHHGYVKRCECMMEAWGYKDKLEVVLGQLVNLFRDGESVRMSKRTGEMVTLEELIDEVGSDATRYLMLAKSSDQPIDFDIEVAKKKDSSNPVYYVQYAHARICSILRKAAAESGMSEEEIASLSTDELAEKLIGSDVNLSLLTHESELAIMRKMADFKAFVETTAKDRAPYRCTHYVEELAALFHGFYTNCHVIQDDKELQKARLALCDASRKLIALVLSLLGVSAPSKM
ncbi:MAG: arginine--tRNA ligase, partial [Phoenicibacter congonensis]|nr:arginine--tRNA ligase [Phoenicibacter congonensis]